jgi:hypothetical protein
VTFDRVGLGDAKAVDGDGRDRSDGALTTTAEVMRSIRMPGGSPPPLAASIPAPAGACPGFRPGRSLIRQEPKRVK